MANNLGREIFVPGDPSALKGRVATGELSGSDLQLLMEQFQFDIAQGAFANPNAVIQWCEVLARTVDYAEKVSSLKTVR